MKINVMRVIHDTTVDGPGFRTSIYCAGCSHQCPDCHNPESWAFGAGDDMNVIDLYGQIAADPFADVTFTGGDPLYQTEAFTELARMIKENTEKNIWCYTGFVFEDIKDRAPYKDLLKYIDVLVDGPFIKKLHDEDALFRGSTNQRLVDVPASLLAQETVLWKPPSIEV